MSSEHWLLLFSTSYAVISAFAIVWLQKRVANLNARLNEFEHEIRRWRQMNSRDAVDRTLKAIQAVRKSSGLDSEATHGC